MTIAPISQLVPVTARGHLNAIAQFHQERDEVPLHFFFQYPLGRGEATQQEAYDTAFTIMLETVSSLCLAERERLWADYGRHLSMEKLQPAVGAELATRPDEERLCHAMARACLVQFFYDMSSHFQAGVPAESRVISQLPHLSARFTSKDFLLPLDDHTRIQETWIAHGEYELQVHPGLRRYLSARPNAGLLHRLNALKENGCRVSIAIDHGRLSAKGTLRQVVELDRWFGFGYRSETLDDPTVAGATLHGRAHDLGPSWTESAGWRTEFRWSAGPLKAFEVEGLPPPFTSDDGRPVVCLYAHAIRDTVSRAFVHLDGALHLYSSGPYGARYEQAINHRLPKVWADTKIKLFRVDADGGANISTDDWADVIQQFFRGNEMVLEYFSGRSFAEIYLDAYGHEHPWLAQRTA